MLEELKKYGALRRQIRETGDWDARKALVIQETIFLMKAVELYDEQPGLFIKLFPPLQLEDK